VVRGISTAITVRRAAAIAIAGAAATALSACGAGQVTQTDSKQSAIAGVNIDEGDLALRDLQVEFDAAEGYAAGDDAALRVWIANEGDEEISLVGVETEAGTVTFVSPAAQAEAEAAESASATDDASATDGAEETTGTEDATGAESTEESASPNEDAASPTPAENPFDGEASFDVPIAPADHVRLDQGVEGGDYLLVEDLGEELLPGDSIEVVFHFSNGAAITADLPVGQSLESEERSYYEPEEEAEGH
jgi:copper(I)-binding protein